MSGKKRRYITVDERNYYNTLEKAKRVDEERRRAEAAERARRQFEEDLKKSKLYNKSLEDRIKTVSDNLKNQESAVKKQIAATITRTDNALKEQEKKFNEKLEDISNDFADALDESTRRIENLIDTKTDALEKDISDLRDETNKEFDKVRDNISDLAQKVGDPQVLIDAGKDYLDTAIDIVDSLKDSRVEQFFPGELNKVKEKVKKAKDHLKTAGDNAANASNALLTGEDAFAAAHKLYHDLCEAEVIWKAKLALALEALTLAESEIEVRKSFVVKCEDGTDIALDTDYWSDNALKDLEAQIDNVRNILTDGEKAKSLSVTDLEGIAKLSDEIVAESKEVRESAISAVLASQERNKLAKTLKTDLVNRGGLTLVDAEGYEGDDSRAANLIHLRNGTSGFEVVVTLTPVLINGRFGYDADTEIINIGDNQKDAQKFDQLLKSIMGSYGLTGGGPIPVNSDKPEEIKDWNDRETPKSVSKLEPNPKIITKVKDIKKKTTA